MLSRLIGLYLLIDGIGSWLIYRKQKLVITKKRVFSILPFIELKIKKLRKSGITIRTFKQRNIEHLFRFVRAGIGLGLLIAPLPF